MNRELAIQLAKQSNVSVSLFVPKCSDEDKMEARKHNVKVAPADELPGFEETSWLSFPPKDLVIDFIIGHSVVLGKHGQIIRRSHNCKWLQFVHTAPDELAVYKDYCNAIAKGERKQWDEIKLCRMADLVVAVGPKLVEFYTAHLRSCGKKVYNFTPSIFTDLSSIELTTQLSKTKFRILVFGRGDSEDFELKGFDIAAKAVAALNDRSYLLTFLGAPSGKETEVRNRLLQCDDRLSQNQLTVKGYLENREDLTCILCASNLVIIPSRTEGFGLTALEALSTGLPFLVSQNTGFAEAIQDIGPSFIVDSEDPKVWAEGIRNVRQKGSDRGFEECRKLRIRYAERYSWENQCKDLVESMQTLAGVKEPSEKESVSGDLCFRAEVGAAAPEIQRPRNVRDAVHEIQFRQTKEGTVTNSDIQELSLKLGQSWKSLARTLKFGEAELTGVDYTQRRLCEKAYYMLMRWKQRDGSTATYSVLYEALLHPLIQRRELAENICFRL